jgi:central kinetochore subunit Mal2/MCM21
LTAASLRHALQIQTSTLLSAASTADLLNPNSSPPDLTILPTNLLKPSERKRLSLLSERATLHAAHNAQSLYRACAGVTTFRVRDPDPKAVDGGAVLGLRIEVVTRARFQKPFYILLNRPWENRKESWKVHRHTVPAAIPINGIAARHLPAPPRRTHNDNGADHLEGEAPTGRSQDLNKFVRTLRRELVRYHNRMAGIADLRRAAGLDAAGEDKVSAERRGDADAGQGSITDISPADPAAMQIKIDWKDGRSGRLVLDEYGRVTKFVVLNEQGRSRGTTRRLLARGMELDDVVTMLAEEEQAG